MLKIFHFLHEKPFNSGSWSFCLHRFQQLDLTFLLLSQTVLVCLQEKRDWSHPIPFRYKLGSYCRQNNGPEFHLISPMNNWCTWLSESSKQFFLLCCLKKSRPWLSPLIEPITELYCLLVFYFFIWLQTRGIYSLPRKKWFLIHWSNSFLFWKSAKAIRTYILIQEFDPVASLNLADWRHLFASYKNAYTMLHIPLSFYFMLCWLIIFLS